MMRLSKETSVRFVKMSTRILLLAMLVMGVANSSDREHQAKADNLPTDDTPLGPTIELDCPDCGGCLGECDCSPWTWKTVRGERYENRSDRFVSDKPFANANGKSNESGRRDVEAPAEKRVRHGKSVRAKNAERRRQRQLRQERKKAKLLDEIEMALELKEFELADELLDQLEDLGDFEDPRDDREPDSWPWHWIWPKVIELKAGDSRI